MATMNLRVCVCVRVGILEEPRISFFFVLNAETKIPNLKVLFGKRDNNIIITAMIIMCHHCVAAVCGVLNFTVAKMLCLH